MYVWLFQGDIQMIRYVDMLILYVLHKLLPFFVFFFPIYELLHHSLTKHVIISSLVCLVGSWKCKRNRHSDDVRFTDHITGCYVCIARSVRQLITDCTSRILFRGGTGIFVHATTSLRSTQRLAQWVPRALTSG
jgi:hypothetical protein